LLSINLRRYQQLGQDLSKNREFLLKQIFEKIKFLECEIEKINENWANESGCKKNNDWKKLIYSLGCVDNCARMSEKELIFEYRNGAYTEYVSNETQKINSFSPSSCNWQLILRTYENFKLLRMCCRSTRNPHGYCITPSVASFSPRRLAKNHAVSIYYSPQNRLIIIITTLENTIIDVLK
jgi:hypothetical protein